MLDALNAVNMIAELAAINDEEQEAISEVDMLIAKLQAGRIAIDGEHYYKKE